MPRPYDIFNGDADGLCALHQLRLEDPRQSELVTGLKRDIALLDRVDAERGDELTVLDISMKSNAVALARVLERGASVRYFDHHAAGDVPRHPALEAHIDTSPGVYTSLIVDHYLGGRQRMWAVVGAFGDNLLGPAVEAAQSMCLGPAEVAKLRELGECLNYNAYGESLDDLHFHPADLYRALAPYRDPGRLSPRTRRSMCCAERTRRTSIGRLVSGRTGKAPQRRFTCCRMLHGAVVSTGYSATGLRKTIQAVRTQYSLPSRAVTRSACVPLLSGRAGPRHFASSSKAGADAKGLLVSTGCQKLSSIVLLLLSSKPLRDLSCAAMVDAAAWTQIN